MNHQETLTRVRRALPDYGEVLIDYFPETGTWVITDNQPDMAFNGDTAQVTNDAIENCTDAAKLVASYSEWAQVWVRLLLPGYDEATLPCPTCGGENLVTPTAAAGGYECIACVDISLGYGSAQP